MALTKGMREGLQMAMKDAFTQDTLDEFLQNKLDEILAEVVPTGHNFRYICLLLIRRFEKDGRIVELCQNFINFHGNQELVDISNEILNYSVPVNASGEAKPHIVKRRPVLNRSNLWDCLKGLSEDQPDSQLLFITGDAATGKSYSRWLISHYCSPDPPVFIDVADDNELEIDSLYLARRITTRLRPKLQLAVFDDQAQPSRTTKHISDQLVMGLSELQTQTWLVIDGLNSIRVDNTAIELLQRICDAVQLGEILNLRLILIGLNLQNLDYETATYTPCDQVTRPNLKDIENFLIWFTERVEQVPVMEAIAAFARQLDDLLPATLTHQAWKPFHKELYEKCRGIEEGGW